jgi:hypothetical protein
MEQLRLILILMISYTNPLQNPVQQKPGLLTIFYNGLLFILPILTDTNKLKFSSNSTEEKKFFKFPPNTFSLIITPLKWVKMDFSLPSTDK